MLCFFCWLYFAMNVYFLIYSASSHFQFQVKQDSFSEQIEVVGRGNGYIDLTRRKNMLKITSLRGVHSNLGCRDTFLKMVSFTPRL